MRRSGGQILCERWRGTPHAGGACARTRPAAGRAPTPTIRRRGHAAHSGRRHREGWGGGAYLGGGRRSPATEILGWQQRDGQGRGGAPQLRAVRREAPAWRGANAEVRPRRPRPPYMRRAGQGWANTQFLLRIALWRPKNLVWELYATSTLLHGTAEFFGRTQRTLYAYTPSLPTPGAGAAASAPAASSVRVP